MFVGLLLLLLGILMLLDRLEIITGSIWDYFIPLAIAALGISMIADRRRRKDRPEE